MNFFRKITTPAPQLSPEAKFELSVLGKRKVVNEKGEVSYLPSFTPDRAILEMFDRVLLFVADELKRGGSKFHLLGPDPKFRGTAFTQQAFCFWNYEVDNHPVALRRQTHDRMDRFRGQIGAPPTRLMGEMYLVRPETVQKLDSHRENGIKFIRRKSGLIVPVTDVVTFSDRHKAEMAFGKSLQRASDKLPEKLVEIEADMYVGKPEYWEDRLNAMDFSPVKVFRPKVAQPTLNGSPNFSYKKDHWLQSFYNYNPIRKNV